MSLEIETGRGGTTTVDKMLKSKKTKDNKKPPKTEKKLKVPQKKKQARRHSNNMHEETYTYKPRKQPDTKGSKTGIKAKIPKRSAPKKKQKKVTCKKNDSMVNEEVAVDEEDGLEIFEEDSDYSGDDEEEEGSIRSIGVLRRNLSSLVDTVNSLPGSFKENKTKTNFEKSLSDVSSTVSSGESMFGLKKPLSKNSRKAMSEASSLWGTYKKSKSKVSLDDLQSNLGTILREVDNLPSLPSSTKLKKTCSIFSEEEKSHIPIKSISDLHRTLSSLVEDVGSLPGSFKAKNKTTKSFEKSLKGVSSTLSSDESTLGLKKPLSKNSRKAMSEASSLWGTYKKSKSKVSLDDLQSNLETVLQEIDKLPRLKNTYSGVSEEEKRDRPIESVRDLHRNLWSLVEDVDSLPGSFKVNKTTKSFEKTLDDISSTVSSGESGLKKPLSKKSQKALSETSSLWGTYKKSKTKLSLDDLRSNLETVLTEVELVSQKSKSQVMMQDIVGEHPTVTLLKKSYSEIMKEVHLLDSIPSESFSAESKKSLKSIDKSLAKVRDVDVLSLGESFGSRKSLTSVSNGILQGSKLLESLKSSKSNKSLPSFKKKISSTHSAILLLSKTESDYDSGDESEDTADPFMTEPSGDEKDVTSIHRLARTVNSITDELDLGSCASSLTSKSKLSRHSTEELLLKEDLFALLQSSGQIEKTTKSLAPKVERLKNQSTDESLESLFGFYKSSGNLDQKSLREVKKCLSKIMKESSEVSLLFGSFKKKKDKQSLNKLVKKIDSVNNEIKSLPSIPLSRSSPIHTKSTESSFSSNSVLPNQVPTKRSDRNRKHAFV